MRRWLLGVVLAGCTGSDQVDVSERNELGIVAVDVDRSDEAGNVVLVVRGLTSDGSERASVRVTRGLVEFPDNQQNKGSEIIVTVDGDPGRMVTRETRLLSYTARSPGEVSFLSIAQVGSVLRDRASVEVRLAPSSPTPAKEVMYGMPCVLDNLNTSPVAHGCCEQTYYSSLYGEYVPGATIFFRDDQLVVSRANSDYGPCKGSDGSDCDGVNCFYGPNGFARAEFYGPTHSWQHYARVTDDEGSPFCNWDWWSSQLSSSFDDVSGNFPTGQGCPGGEDGAGEWDY